jgi:uncharacterized SAM-binding protein YcdF (DUF218 family)
MIAKIIVAFVTVVVFIVGISFYLQPNDFIGCQEVPVQGTDRCEAVDAIVVVSGGDTNARTDEGIKLFNNGWADALVLSGAAQDKSGPSNAAAMRVRAQAAGVPFSAIYIDEYSETTEQNAENTQSIFSRHGFEKVILVTSGYHQRRASLEFEKRADTVQILNHPLLFDQDWSLWWWLSPRGWWLAGGELVKICAFYIQGASQ